METNLKSKFNFFRDFWTQ